MRRFVVSLAALFYLMVASVQDVTASNDAYFNEQWALSKANVANAWGTSSGGGIRVGVVDSGVDAGHPDLAGRVAESIGCISTSGDGSQCNASGDDLLGHGTHVSGIIAANKGNGEGIAGVAPSAQLVVARVFDQNENTTANDIRAGADWVLDHGARIVNFSLGDTGLLGSGLLVSNSLVKEIVATVWNRGAIPVVSAGNNACANWSNTNAVVVTATGPDDEWAGYACSASGAQWGVAGPGGNASNCDTQKAKCVISTWARSQTPGGSAPYAYIQGTSMAAPAVAGALADLLGKGMSNADAINTLLNTVDAVPCGSGCKGRVNVARAVCGNSCIPDIGSPGPTGTAPPAVTPTSRVTVTTRRPTTQAAQPRPTPTSAVSATTTPPETTTTEAVTTTTEAPPPVTRQALGAKKAGNDDDGVPALPAIIGIAGLLAAGAATGLAGWRRSRAGAGL